MKGWLIALGVGQILDAVTFAAVYPRYAAMGLNVEANPLTAALFAMGGVGLVVGAKYGLSMVVYGSGIRLRHVPRWAYALLIFVTLTGFVGAVSNLVAL